MRVLTVSNGIQYICIAILATSYTIKVHICSGNNPPLVNNFHDSLIIITGL